MFRWSWLAVAASATVFALPAFAAASVPPPIVPPVDNLYDNLGTRGWQYVMAQPTTDNQNPLRDPTGANCRDGQSGAVFFLVGQFNTSGTLTRERCTVSAGKFLFFPLFNAFDVHVPGHGLDTPQAAWIDLHAPGAGAFAVEELHATIDGVTVPASLLRPPARALFRGCSGPPDLAPGCAPAFTIDVPPASLLDLLGAGDFPAGFYFPTVSDGYYLMLAPPLPGLHKISFGGTGTTFGHFSVTTIYKLRVTAS